MRKKVIIDCDTGHDDAVAIALALASPALDVLGITTVAGNQTGEKTFRNTLKTVTYLGHDLPVARGSDRPLVRELKVADYVHGESGLEFGGLPEKTIDPSPLGAVDFMYRAIMDAGEKVILMPIGPLTNIALLFLRHPDVKPRIRRITLMGGCWVSGNVTAAAEFNFHVDPEAANVVFSAGIPIIMHGLDVTHKAIIKPDELERIGQIDTPAARLVYGVMQHYGRYPFYGDLGGIPIHDACPVLYETDDTIFETIPAHIDIEYRSELCDGSTICDVRSRWKNDKPRIHEIVTGVKRDRYVDIMCALLGAAGPAVEV